MLEHQYFNNAFSKNNLQVGSFHYLILLIIIVIEFMNYKGSMISSRI